MNTEKNKDGTNFATIRADDLKPASKATASQLMADGAKYAKRPPDIRILCQQEVLVRSPTKSVRSKRSSLLFQKDTLKS